MLGWDDALLLAGGSILSNAASQGLGALIGSGGSSANDQIRLWNKMYEPRSEFGGLSKAQIQQMVELQGYKKSLDDSASVNLSYNQALNQVLPSSMRLGLEAAGYNPMLAIMGNYSAQTGGVSGANMQSPHLGTVTRPNRSFSSAVGAEGIYKMLSGYFKTEQENKEADTDNKEVMTSDIEASANLKNAEANLTNEKAETERKMREPEYENSVLKSRWGDGFTGSVGRYGETFLEALEKTIKSVANGFSTSSAASEDKARTSDKPTIIIEPSTSKDTDRYLENYNKRKAFNPIYFHGWH